MRCTNCGHENEPDAKFCTKCGANIEESFQKEELGSVDRYFKEQRHSLIEDAELLAESEMKQGVIWFVIALVITGVTWLLASEGETYYVFWGALFYGIYRLIRGFWYKMNPESLLEKAEKEADKAKQIK